VGRLESVSGLSCQKGLKKRYLSHATGNLVKSIEIYIDRREKDGKWKEDRIQSIKLYDDYRKQGNAIKELASDPDDSQSAEQASFTARLFQELLKTCK
jgi:catechol-2,3-dioxygenase